MIFEKITISNLFSYLGEVSFDFTGQQPDRPIILISGRNGFGKTSFLNSIKLLFTGPHEDLRNSIVSKRKLSQRRYILGQGEEWMGALHRHARTQLNTPRFYVQCEWNEQDGAVTALREWFPDGDFNPDGTLSIHTNFMDEKLIGSDAQQFIEKRLPSSYLPFFFFDGELVQHLAQANKSQLADQVEGILNIAPINSLLLYLNKVNGGWAKKGAKANEQRILNQIKRDCEEINDQLSALKEKNTELKHTIESITDQIEDLERRIRSLQGFDAQEEETQLKAKLIRIQDELAQLRVDVVNLFAPAAPLTVNQPLLEKISLKLEQHDTQSPHPNKEFLGYLRRHLPLQVFDRPAPSDVQLSSTQSQFFQDRLIQALDGSIEQSKNDKSIQGLPVEKTRRSTLKRILIPIQENDPLPDHAQRLTQIRRLSLQQSEIKLKLENASSLHEEDRHQLQSLREQKNALSQQKEKHLRDSGRTDLEIEQKKRDLKRKQIERNDQEKQIVKASRYHELSKLTIKLKDCFDDYKQALRSNRRKSVEETINRHYKILMTSNDLLHKISVDENFGIHYEDQDGALLGSASLSAGMKQLAAISLLWALKEVAKKSVPIIVDTPLARIDRKNQENLLRSYFPKASEQVIMLPTDSELDPTKYKILSPFIYREYQLDNPSGDGTQAHEQSMYPDDQEA
ncbi:MAG: DNA sulfur modification protein DndD [Magnetococcales bacterium]|nr:DNA sulfur modification protein DndD [Magnetococcales bacterium]